MEYLKNCNKLSGEVWNLCLELDKKFRSDNGKGIGNNDLQKQTKKCVFLHANGIHHVVHKYLFARDSMFRSIKAGTKNVKLPYRIKKYFTSGWSSQNIKVDYNRGVLMLTRPVINLDGGSYKLQKPACCYSKNIPQNIVEIELIFKEKYYLAVKYKEDLICHQIQSNISASIDLGEIHAITSIDSSGNAIIITGRKMRSIKRLRNKEQAKLRSRISKCTKGSRQYKKYMSAYHRIRDDSNRKILDCIHKISKLFLDYCIENNISKVFYGDLDSATRNTKQNHVASTYIRQKLSQWNYGQLMKHIENKISRYGVELEKVKEYYTSQTCPSCKERNKPTKRNYSCVCGYTQHRDIVGAINILNDNSGTQITHYKGKKYLQIA